MRGWYIQYAAVRRLTPVVSWLCWYITSVTASGNLRDPRKRVD
jgi:hypothetical protein